MIPEPFASYAEVSSHLQYYRDRAYTAEARIRKLETMLRNVLAVTGDNRTVPLALKRDIRNSLKGE